MKGGGRKLIIYRFETMRFRCSESKALIDIQIINETILEEVL